MTGRIYVLKIKGDLKEKLGIIKKMARTTEMEFEGDEKRGRFDGGPYVVGFQMRFRGTYAIQGDKIEITLLEKPALVSWELVESTLRKFVQED